MSASPILAGALLLLLSEILFAGIGAMIKHLSQDLSQSQLVFFRNLFALLPLLPWLHRNGLQGLKTQIPKMHLARATCGLLAMYCFFYVIANIPLAQAMMILLVAPFIVPLISRIWLKEQISTITIAGIAIGFVGAAIALKPNPDTDFSGYSLYIAIAGFATCLVAFNKVAIRKMSATEPSTRIVFYFTAFCCIVSFVPVLLNWQTISSINWLWLLAIGLCAGIGQLMMTKAFQLASPSRIGLLTYSSVLFAGIFGYLFWQEPFTPHLLGGSLLIFWAAWISTRQRWFR